MSAKIPARRFDGLTMPINLEPPLSFAGRGLNEVIFSDDVVHCYEQSTAIALGLAEHPSVGNQLEPIVPKFGATEEERKIVAKALKDRAKKLENPTWQ